MGMVEIAAASLAVTAFGTAKSIESQKDARRDARRAADEQRKIQQEQVASNAQAAAQERRQQIREERVRRAKIIQASMNTGVSGGSGEAGAVSGLATNLSSNLGANLGAIERGQRTSIFAQNAADFSFSAQQNSQRAGAWAQYAGMGMSIFSAAGGFGSFNGGAKNPAFVPPPK